MSWLVGLTDEYVIESDTYGVGLCTLMVVTEGMRKGRGEVIKRLEDARDRKRKG